MKVFNTYEDIVGDVWYCIPNRVYYFSTIGKTIYHVSVSTKRFNEWVKEANTFNKFTKVKVGVTYD